MVKDIIRAGLACLLALAIVLGPNAIVYADDSEERESDTVIIDIGIGGDLKVDIDASGPSQLNVGVQGPSEVNIDAGDEVKLNVEASDTSRVCVDDQRALGAVSMGTKVQLEKGTICISYSSEEDVLRINYSNDDKECQLVLISTQRMGLLMQVAGAEITYSLRFLEEEETWPTADTLKEEEYTSKTIFKAPGWIVIIVQKAE